jgi:SLT domain-containing protein
LVVGLWNGFWSTLGGIKDAIVGFFVGIGTWIYNKFMAGVALVRRVKDMFKDAILNAMAMVLNPISTFWNNNIKGIVPKMTVPNWVPGLGGKSFGPSPDGLKMYAEGGLVNRPTLGMVGEAGPEAIIPLRSGNVPVQITGRQSEAEMVKAIKELSQQVATNGNTFNISVDASGVVAASDRAKAELAKELAEAVFKQIVSNIPGAVGDTASRAWYS